MGTFCQCWEAAEIANIGVLLPKKDTQKGENVVTPIPSRFAILLETYEGLE